MEILMNIKCSANSNGASMRPTLKVVDHHHQLQQQHNPLKTQRPPGLHLANNHGKPNLTITASKESSLPCMNFTGTTPMNCCNAVHNPKSIIDLQWAMANQKHSNVCNVLGINPPADCPSYCEYAPCCASMEMPSCCASYTTVTPTTHMAPSILETFSPMAALYQNDNNTFYEYHEPEENFVSIEDEKVKEFLMKIGENQNQKQKESKQEIIEEKKKDELAIKPVVFEIIELDDIDEREKLQRISETAERHAKEEESLLSSSSSSSSSSAAVAAVAAVAQVPPPLIKAVSRKETRKSPSIYLIPKRKDENESPQKPKEKIIARIDLLDSDSDDADNDDDDEVNKKSEILQEKKSILENSRDGADVSKDNYVEEGEDDVENDEDNDDSVSSRLIAAAAVSCELGCDDDNEEGNSTQTQENDTIYSSAEEPIFIINSEDEENIEFIEEREEGLELRWDDLEDHSNSRERSSFECPVCGKKVQSNYNLRRHMMIHTGERPFGCDLCERRFREISDLKKHRRRHASEKNFVCMICRINPPLETDSTRCNSCDTKNGTLIAAVRPDTVKTPPEIEQMFGSTLRGEKRKLNSITPPTNLPPITPIISKPSIEITTFQTENSTSKPSSQLCYQTTFNQIVTRKDFQCPLCSRSFGTRHNLKRHYMIHTGEKPFSCPSCRKPFREYSTLKKHMVTHRRDRLYKCILCPKKYRDYLDYMEHKSTHSSDVSSDDGSVTQKRSKYHTNDDQEDSYFTNDDDDEDNEYDDDISTAEDCLECCECGQRFNEIEQFTTHIREHDSNRITYECYMCKELFTDHKVLVDHMNEKHQSDENDV